MSNIYNIENTIQPISDDFSTDGTLDEFSRVDHQHALSASLLSKIVNRVPTSSGLPSVSLHKYELWMTQDTFEWYYSDGATWWPVFGNRNTGAIGRNLLDNGQMKISQRYPGGVTVLFSVMGTHYVADRWQYLHNEAINITAQVNVNILSGLTNSFNRNGFVLFNGAVTKVIAAGEYQVIRQGIEGYRLQELLWGTASAKPITATFVVYVTHTCTVALNLVYNGANRINTLINLVAGYQIVTTTFPGHTTIVPPNDNTAQLYFDLWIAAGSTYNNGNPASIWGKTWSGAVPSTGIASGVTPDFWGAINRQIVLVEAQLEVGSISTPVEVISYGETLARCQRFFEIITNTTTVYKRICMGQCILSSVNSQCLLPFLVEKRVSPSAVTFSAANTFAITNSAGNAIVLTAIALSEGTTKNIMMLLTHGASTTAGFATQLMSNATTATRIEISSEI